MGALCALQHRSDRPSPGYLLPEVSPTDPWELDPPRGRRPRGHGEAREAEPVTIATDRTWLEGSDREPCGSKRYAASSDLKIGRTKPSVCSTQCSRTVSTRTVRRGSMANAPAR